MDKQLDQDAGKSHEFISKVEALAKMKAENPQLRLGAGHSLREEIAMTEAESMGIRAPKKSFMALDTYRKKWGEPSPEMVKTITFRGQRIQGVDVQKEEDVPSRFQCFFFEVDVHYSLLSTVYKSFISVGDFW